MVYRWLPFVLCLSILVGCGTDDDRNARGASAEPVISNLNCFPNFAYLGQGGGSIEVKWSFNFTDQDGDVRTLRGCMDGDCGIGPEACEEEILPIGLEGSFSGTVTWRTNVRTDCPPGPYHGTVSVIDALGQESNRLRGSLLLIEWP